MGTVTVRILEREGPDSVKSTLVVVVSTRVIVLEYDSHHSAIADKDLSGIVDSTGKILRSLDSVAVCVLPSVTADICILVPCDR